MKAVVYWIGTAVCVIALAALLSGSSQAERRQTSRNVAKLVEESRLNRELICLVALRDPNNPAWASTRVIGLCTDVGVLP